MAGRATFTMVVSGALMTIAQAYTTATAVRWPARSAPLDRGHRARGAPGQVVSSRR
jgi:hypothetical protein